MKLKLAISVGVLALLGLLGVTVAEMQTGQDVQPEQAGTQQAAALPAPVESVLVAAPPAAEAATLPAPSAGQAGSPKSPNRSATRDTDSKRARGLYIRPDGTTVGRMNYIDRNTLRLMPVPNALVSFLQDRKIIAQAMTDEHGIFAVSGLTPWSVCSVTASSPDWVCMFSTVIRPYNHSAARPENRGPAAAKGAGVTSGWVNEIRFASMVRAAEEPAAADAGPAPDASAPVADGSQPAGEGQATEATDSQQDAGESEAAENDDGTVEDYTGYEFLEVQPVPREDFQAAIRAGLLGSDAGGLPGGMSPGSGVGGGGGGGGGGSGGGGAGLGAGLIGAGMAAGIGAALGAGQGNEVPASPFSP